MDTQKNYLSLGDLDPFVDKVNSEVLGEKTEPTAPDTEASKEPLDMTPAPSEACIKNPGEVPEDTLYQLADLVDGYGHFQQDDEEHQVGPNTADRIRSSLAVVYVLEDGIPVAGAILVDPTQENYQGIVPGDYYELKSGENLEGRIQQDFFVVQPDKKGRGYAGQLKKALESIAEKMFVVITSTDKDTEAGLLKNGYTFLSEFETDWEDVPVQLWIN